MGVFGCLSIPVVCNANIGCGSKTLRWASVVLPERQLGVTSPQVAVHAHGLLAPVDERARLRSHARPPLPLCYGREGLQARIREAVRLAELFAGWVVEEPGWELCAPRPFSAVCFRHEGADDLNEAIVEGDNRSGELFLSHTGSTAAT
jgi:hypothetical protein